MRIALWLRTFLPEIGGIQTLGALLADGAARLGHEVLVLAAPGPRCGEARERRPSGVHVARVGPAEPLAGDLDDRLAVYRAYEREIDEFAPDVVHVHVAGPYVAYANELHVRRALPWMLTVHNNHAGQGRAFGRESPLGTAIATADAVTAVSHDTCRWLVDTWPEHARRIAVIHNGIEAPQTTTAVPPQGPIVFVGRLEPQKRLDVLLHAFARVVARNDTARLRIVGDGSQRDELDAQRQALGLGGRVDFVGALPTESVAAELRAARALVLSSDFEGLPIVALEAAANARAVVATRAGGIAELVDDGVTGLLVEVGDIDGLADALSTVVDDPALAVRLGAAGRERVASEFGADRCVQAYVERYGALVGRWSAEGRGSANRTR